MSSVDNSGVDRSLECPTIVFNKEMPNKLLPEREMVALYFTDTMPHVPPDILYLVLTFSGLVGPRHFWVYWPRNSMRLQPIRTRLRAGRSHHRPR